MIGARAFCLMLSISVLVLRTCETRAADKKARGDKGEASNSMSASSQTSTSSNEVMYGSGDESTTTTTASTPSNSSSTTTTTTTPQPTMVFSNATTSNYSSATNVSTANSTQPPYVDQYGNNLPKVVNATQYYAESPDMMDKLPVVPLDEINNANGNNVWVVYRIPTGGVAPTQIEPSQPGNYVNQKYEIEENAEQFTTTTTTTGCPSMQPDYQVPQQPPPPPQQQQQGYYVVVRPVEAYQQDYYKTGSSDGAQIKPLNNFFYR